MKVFTVICVLAFIAASVYAEKSSSTSSSQSTSASRQARFEDRKLRTEDGKELSSFLNAKYVLRSVVKLLFGSDEESRATSRQVLNVFVKVLEMFKSSFSQKARSMNSNRGVREAVDDAAVAGVSMLKGYVKSILAGDDQCAQRHLCESSKEAIREGREIGHIIAQVGGYATSYLLQHQKATPFNQSYDAARRGRSGEDCGKIYLNCNETD